MAGLNGKDIGETQCVHCMELITPEQKWIRCATCHKGGAAYRNVHETCVDEHRKEHLARYPTMPL